MVVIGSGAAGMTAALAAHCGGMKVAIFEKDSHFGGSTAVSGGAIWIPDNPKMRAAGMNDNRDEAYDYIANETGELLKPGMVRAFLEAGPEMVGFMEEKTHLKFEHRAFSPDYHSDRPGAALGGRVLDAKTFDGRLLKNKFTLLKPPISDFTLFGGMMLNRFDIGHFMNMTRRPASAWHAFKLFVRYARDRLFYSRGTRLVLGQAVAGRLAYSAIEKDIPIFTEVALASLKVEDGGVVGFNTNDGREILARHAVVLATGGFPANDDLRKMVMPHIHAGSRHYTMSPKPATGAAITAAESIGAQFIKTNRHAGYWAPISLIPDRRGERPFPHLFLDRAKPGVIAVNSDGRRFVNEAVSYHDFVTGMIEEGVHEAWLVCDHQTLRKYGLGPVRPFPAPFKGHLRTGYLKKGASLKELAEVTGISSECFIETVHRFNNDARVGTDQEFGKGSTDYQTYLGDPEHRPNPCLKPLEKPPFYAIRIYPGDIGTTMGLATDEKGRVLDKKDNVIPGLYACGNDMNSIMAGAYPSAGITLGPALTFGYIVGRYAAEAAGASKNLSKSDNS
nr:FAD-dependent oxidoreductase [Halomonas zhangzhouensis]